MFKSAPPMIFAEIYQSGKTVVDFSLGNLDIFCQNMHPWSVVQSVSSSDSM